MFWGVCCNHIFKKSSRRNCFKFFSRIHILVIDKGSVAYVTLVCHERIETLYIPDVQWQMRQWTNSHFFFQGIHDPKVNAILISQLQCTTRLYDAQSRNLRWFSLWRHLSLMSLTDALNYVSRDKVAYFDIK